MNEQIVHIEHVVHFKSKLVRFIEHIEHLSKQTTIHFNIFFIGFWTDFTTTTRTKTTFFDKQSEENQTNN